MNPADMAREAAKKRAARVAALNDLVLSGWLERRPLVAGGVWYTLSKYAQVQIQIQLQEPNTGK